MRGLLPTLLLASALAALAPLPARTEPAADLATLARGWQALPASGRPGTAAVLGRSSFALATDTGGVRAVAAAGFYRDDPRGGRAVLFAHRSFYLEANAAQSGLIGNVIRWLSRSDQPVVRCGPGAPPAPASAAGFSARFTGGPALPDDLQTADVLIVNLHSDLADDEWSLIRDFAARGGGLLFFATPAELDDAARAEAAAILSDFGLGLAADGPEGRLFPVARAYQPLGSAYHSLVAIAQDRQGSAPLSASDRRLAAATIDTMLAAGGDRGIYARALDQVSKAFGWITMSESNPLVRADRPLEAVVARYQGRQLEQLPPDEVPAHPSAADWPGSCGAGEPSTLKVRVDARNAAESEVLRNTALYARPGQVVTVTAPDEALGEGLRVRIGIHTDDLSDCDRYLRCPRITREAPITNRTTRIASAFGGLVEIVVPRGCKRGTVDLTIAGAITAPVFRRGTDQAGDWPRLRANPGAWGYIETSNFCVYASRRQLLTLDNPDDVAVHWDRVIALCDQMLGYAGWRRAPEAAATDVQLPAGKGRPGCPVMMPYGDGDELLRGVLRDGDWATYRQLGHNYQDHFNSEYNIAAGDDVEADLAPALLMSALHRRSPWDEDVDSVYDAEARLAARRTFSALPPDERTWARACETPAARDFYFGLGEAFGWELYGRALGRLMRSLRTPAAEPELASLASVDAMLRRDRLLLLLSQEAKRNLLPFAERYGLGQGEFGISDSVRRQLQKLPVWNGNQPPTDLSMPDTLTVPESAPPGTLLYTFRARDPDPGNQFAYRLVRGNEDGAFALDARSGELRVVDLDFERAPDYLLAVEVTDVAVPRFGLTNFFEVVVSDVDEAPCFETQLFEASSRLAPAAALGTLAVTTEDGRALDTCELVQPKPEGAFALDADTRRLRLADPTRLPSNGVQTLSITARDASGRQGSGTIFILANERGGLKMERWNGHDMAGPPAVVSQVDDPNLLASAGSNFTRRISGWLVPPRSGSYTFWTSGDDSVELFLSTDEQPAHRKRVAFNRRPTRPQEWDARPSQRSAPLQLRAGNFYYIEVLHREEQGEDHVEIAWEGPGFERELLPRRVLLPHQ